MLKAGFRSYIRYKCWTLNVLLPHNYLDYLTYTWWSMKTTKSWHFLIESQSNDEPSRDRPISQDPTNADRSLQLFPPHILPLCNLGQHLNTCASQEMQLYASHRIATENSSSRLAWMQIAYLRVAVCYCLHLIMCLCLRSSTLLFYSELKRHCLCTMRTCHTCLIAWDMVIINRS